MSAPQIHFLKSKDPVEADSQIPIMDVLMNAGVPVASSCGGEGICAKCKITVLDGAQNLSAETDLEESVRMRGLIGSGERLSCQTRLIGPSVKIDTSYW